MFRKDMRRPVERVGEPFKRILGRILEDEIFDPLFLVHEQPLDLGFDCRLRRIGLLVAKPQQAAEGTTQVSANISAVQRGAIETGTASAQVLSSAQSLSQESERLKLEVDRFLSTVRAA